MQSCLGIYIESNIIKYAKVSKEKTDFKVESFGIRFFENIGQEIDKIIEETFSFSTPIAVNLSNEKYLYFDVFALLNKKDISKTIETEFESYCDEKQYNTYAFEMRYAITKNPNDKEKFRAMTIFANKIDMTRYTDALESYKLDTVIPTSIAIASLPNLAKRENQLIVNMEEKTSIVTVLDQQVYNIETLDYGARDVLDSINKIENSYAKAYDICKNTTIYTADVEETEQPYLQYIIPTIFKIAERLKEIVADETIKCQTIYLTGTLSTINNIDLYFQEFLPKVEVKILRPKFLENGNMKINIKEYIEVNSAIALAMCGLGEGIQELNFRKVKPAEKLSQMFKIEIGNKNSKKKASAKRGKGFWEDLKGAFDATEIWLIRGCAAILLIMLIFIIFSKGLENSMLSKEKEIETSITEQSKVISAITSNKASLDIKTQKYQSLIADLDEIDRKTSDIAAKKRAIPNLLQKIMTYIPEKVQLVSIENPTDSTISIQAMSEDYDQLGYFIAVLKTEGILKNVVSSSGTKNEGVVSVTIGGDLP